jgi:hypothetical protein
MEQRLLADSNTIIDYVGNRLPEQAASFLVVGRLTNNHE